MRLLRATNLEKYVCEKSEAAETPEIVLSVIGECDIEVFDLYILCQLV